MNWTVRKRLVGQSLLGMTLILLVGVSGWVGVQRTERISRQLGSSARGLRHQLGIATLHGAMRADVARGLAAPSPAERRAARDDFAAHASTLDGHLQEMAKLELDPDTRSAFEEARPTIERFVADGTRLLDDTGRGDRELAAGTQARFEADYARVSTLLSNTGDRLEASVARSAHASQTIGAVSRGLSTALPLIAVLALLLVAHLVSRSITAPLDAAVGVLDAIAGGDLNARLPVTSDDELGRMAHAVNRAVFSLSATLSGITRNAVAVGNASEELAAVSHELFDNANESSTQSSVVSSAAEQVNANVRLVAASAQQVGASIREVAQGALEAAAVARTAVTVAEQANGTVRKLGDSSEQIENVVKVITSIAEQTNILALNAEIEAARAGDAGKGFAVVANEVKELAKETARATEDIGRRIDAIQADSRAAVATIAEIVTIINRISMTQDKIASAVEEQSAATAEITRNMGEASRGTAEIADTIGGVARVSGSTSAGARETQKAANELAMMAAELQRLVGQFRYTTAGGREHGAGPVTPAARALPDTRAAA